MVGSSGKAHFSWLDSISQWFKSYLKQRNLSFFCFFLSITGNPIHYEGKFTQRHMYQDRLCYLYYRAVQKTSMRSLVTRAEAKSNSNTWRVVPQQHTNNQFLCIEESAGWARKKIAHWTSSPCSPDNTKFIFVSHTLYWDLTYL